MHDHHYDSSGVLRISSLILLSLLEGAIKDCYIKDVLTFSKVCL